MSTVRRITLFKIPNQEDQQKLLGMYANMATKALKNSQPYIISVEARRTQPDQRNQGFTIVAISTFKSAEDFEFYDKDCEAHAELRTFARSVAEGFCMVYFNVE
ncbi:hypothetical protein CC86DRAFT_303045 [Ophiobolus disseminans]|uniref:Stress-response A/B barrel domain-containing protein n=1 Tax=Ophiobolus disseminans TaxID=1469910 RepID=A0A6A6ZL81_9PLEO|nr:hypothetical protein CC86DRAFT_303045 [Ophiobolus disseminans]